MIDNGALFGIAMGKMMADDTFRNIMGMKLLQDDNKMNDGIGMALLMDSKPPISAAVQPLTLKSMFNY